MEATVFNTFFTNARHKFLSWTRCIQTASAHNIPLEGILILSLYYIILYNYTIIILLSFHLCLLLPIFLIFLFDELINTQG